MYFRQMFSGLRKKISLKALSYDRMAAIERKIDALESYSHGARAVYLGNGRVLLKAVVFGANIAYILEADDRLLAPWFIVSGHYESSLTNWLVPRLRTDSVCLDIGANFGYFTCVFARFAPKGKVIGVEPDPTVFAILRDNVLINGFNGHTSVLNAAVSDSTGQMTLYRRSIRSGNTSMIKMSDEFTSSLGEEPVEPFVAPTLTVDQICADLGGRLDFLKIDVEGAEPLVFKGAREAIKNNKKLNVVFEWSPSQIKGARFDLKVFLDELKELGFFPFSLDEAGQEKTMTYDDLLRSPYMAGVVLRRV